MATLILVTTFSLVLGSCRHPPETVARRPRPADVLGLQGKGLESYHLEETIPRRFGQLTLWRPDTGSDQVIKVETYRGLDSESAHALVNDGVMGLEALYANALSPYPEDLSREIAGDATFQPRLIQPGASTEDHFPYLLLFANERLGYGSTTRGAIRYKSLLGWIYCPDTQVLHRIRWFVPLTHSHQDLQEQFRSIHCGGPP